MAVLVHIPGNAYPAKIRSLAAPILLPFITLGIYSLVWYYKVNKEMATLGVTTGNRKLGNSPGTSLLAVTLGVLLIVPPIVSIVRTFKRVQETQRATGAGETINGWIGLLVWFVGLIPGFLLGISFLYGYMQTGLNKAWKRLPRADSALHLTPSQTTPGEAQSQPSTRTGSG
jgi:Na+/proline symporter